MDDKPKKCVHKILREDCDRCDRLDRLAIQMEKAEALHDPLDPKRVLKQLTEEWDQANGRGKLESPPTRVLPPPDIPKLPERPKKKTRKQTRSFPRVLDIPEREPPPPPETKNGTCLVSNCEYDGKEKKQGLCKGCFSLKAHWIIQHKDVRRMSMIPTKEQLETFSSLPD